MFKLRGIKLQHFVSRTYNNVLLSISQYSADLNSCFYPLINILIFHHVIFSKAIWFYKYGATGWELMLEIGILVALKGGGIVPIVIYDSIRKEMCCH